MAEHEEPQMPDDPPGDDRESVEVRLHFEQRLPGGLIQFSRHYVRRRNRPQRPQASGAGRRNFVVLVIFFTLIIIGLIAVGPEGVWREAKELLTNLFK